LVSKDDLRVLIEDTGDPALRVLVEESVHPFDHFFDGEKHALKEGDGKAGILGRERLDVGAGPHGDATL
jgi:hypothetical protein